MLRTRRKPAEAGTCHAVKCQHTVDGVELLDSVGQLPGAFCKKHRLVRDTEIRERNARSETAPVLVLADYERDPDTRAGSVWKRA